MEGTSFTLLIDKVKEDPVQHQENLFKLGRALFYEKKLSSNNSIACASCHIQKFAFSDTAKFSRGVQGFTRRNSMSLVNLETSRRFFWDGRAVDLEHQVMTPLQNNTEMNSRPEDVIKKLNSTNRYRKLFKKAYDKDTITMEGIINAIVFFEKNIISRGSRFDAFLKDSSVFTKQEKLGYRLFMTVPDPTKGIRGAGCSVCHEGQDFNNATYFNNGLDSLFTDKGVGQVSNLEHDEGTFKVPSLRNVYLTAPYMHDGRFKTLEEVVEHYSGHIKKGKNIAPFLVGMSNSKNGSQLVLSEGEKKAIVSFLIALTDTKLVENKKYRKPTMF